MQRRESYTLENTVKNTVQKLLIVLVPLVAALLMVGCSTPNLGGTVAEAQSSQGDASIVPVLGNASHNSVIAEGVVEPSRSSRLAFEIPGEVVDVLVETGDKVEAGDLLVHLDTRQLELALRSAEQDVISQQAALQQLLDGASDKVVGRADKANADQIAQAEVALEVKQLQLEKARAEDPSIAVAAAQARVKQLELALAQSRAQDPKPSVIAAEVALERARIALEDTQDEYNKALDRPWEDQEIRDAWSKRLEQAGLDFKAAQAQLNGALNAQRAHTVSLGIFSAQIEEAKTQLGQALIAQETFSTTLEILTADVESARLQLEALRTWDNPYRDEASDPEITQAHAMLEKTRIVIEQLELQLEDAELVAPYAGTVVDVQAKVGDEVSPGHAVVVLATIDDLEINTTDLTELDVGSIAVGQPVRVTVDAFPDREFAGTVSEIALQGQDYRGDVAYKVTVELDDPTMAADMRWGMTTMVEVETE